MKTNINIIIFGLEQTGSLLINEIIATQEIFAKKNIVLKIPMIANDTIVFFENDLKKFSWEANMDFCGFPYKLANVFDFINDFGFENLIIIDATNQKEMISEYTNVLKGGHSIVTLNQMFQISPLKINLEYNASFHSLKEKIYQVNSKVSGLICQEILEQISNQYASLSSDEISAA